MDQAWLSAQSKRQKSHHGTGTCPSFYIYKEKIYILHTHFTIYIYFVVVVVVNSKYNFFNPTWKCIFYLDYPLVFSKKVFLVEPLLYSRKIKSHKNRSNFHIKKKPWQQVLPSSRVLNKSSLCKISLALPWTLFTELFEMNVQWFQKIFISLFIYLMYNYWDRTLALKNLGKNRIIPKLGGNKNKGWLYYFSSCDITLFPI